VAGLELTELLDQRDGLQPGGKRFDRWKASKLISPCINQALFKTKDFLNEEQFEKLQVSQWMMQHGMMQGPDGPRHGGPGRDGFRHDGSSENGFIGRGRE
jgi:hypothetical protein